MSKDKLLSDEALKNIFAQIETPEYNPGDDVMQKIRQGVKPKRKIRRLHVIAAVFAAMLVLAGAGAVYEIVRYDMDGNIRDKDMNNIITTYNPTKEEENFTRELCKNQKDYEIIFELREHQFMKGFLSAVAFPAYKTIEDYDDLKDCLQNNGAEEFILPEYIPEGYEFKYAKVYFELSKDSNYEEAELLYSEEKFGNIYEKYILPENGRIVNHVSLYFYKGDIFLCWSIGFSHYSNIDDMTFGMEGTAKQMTEPEILDLPQFDRSLIMSYKNGFFNSNPLWILRAVRLLDEPAEVELLTLSFISKTWREAYERYEEEYQNKLYPDNFNIWERGSVNYTTSSKSTFFSSVSRDDIIKMAESIK